MLVYNANRQMNKDNFQNLTSLSSSTFYFILFFFSKEFSLHSWVLPKKQIEISWLDNLRWNYLKTYYHFKVISQFEGILSFIFFYLLAYVQYTDDTQRKQSFDKVVRLEAPNYGGWIHLDEECKVIKRINWKDKWFYSSTFYSFVILFFFLHYKEYLITFIGGLKILSCGISVKLMGSSHR